SPAQSNRPEVTLTGSCPQPAPVCRRRLSDGTCDREQPAICADAFWLCPPGTFPNETCLPRDSDAAVPPDTAADTAAIFGCPKACPAGQVCAILDYFSGGRTGSCVASPAQCRPEAGAPDAGALSCNQCVGFTVCRGAFGCLTPPGGALYTCGI
ncbi:MAG TPA: hypothetical protein VN914_04300, partial [Polyangia bacterium]|nr:hypothetical protein [Polyangia bacterium]